MHFLAQLQIGKELEDLKGFSEVSQIDLISPIDGKVFAQAPSNDLNQTDLIIEKAQKAFQSWRNVSPADRAKLLRKFVF